MFSIIRTGELQPNRGGTVQFEGESHGSEISFFLVNAAPGMGPALHKHPRLASHDSGMGGGEIIVSTDDRQ